ncbi:hypothetical protein [Kitasatospora aureofaciens]|uniref:hypothetical protein n=1 Tax=Kitasatospora aureofaciens TaxID=1894 RepID=UPI001C4640D0|nr:hypothetical protein [Kitasatospora aureofaciens]MBV6698375.1 hypothetical protein [Kitasatospora aureofaciens]
MTVVVAVRMPAFFGAGLPSAQALVRTDAFITRPGEASLRRPARFGNDHGP